MSEIYIKNPILMGKVKNAVKKKFNCSDVEFKLKNININGNKHGCCGFITNLVNGVTVYVDTKVGVYHDVLYRFAKDNKDFTGCRNRFAYNFDDFVNEVCECLNMPEQYKRELVSYRKVDAE